MRPAGHVTYRKDGPVGHITFDRPDARNALTPAMYAELDAICATVRADGELRAVVLRGAGGKSFASGSDIAQFLEFQTPEDGLDYERRMAAHLDAIAAIPVPTLAVIEGFAVGGGLNLAAACDIRIATTGSQFGTPIARALGNCLSIANYARLLNAFGEGRARRMLLLGELLDADEALACGFLSRVAAPELIDSEAEAILAQLLANAPLSLRVSKTALGRLTAAHQAEIEDEIRRIYGSEDFRGAVRAFFEKRKPEWRGR
ncbi:MAG TPA: enoyl-CoA hydratase [Alphaproteobacteria bacterium]|nr:enoyl-CoA hydratase [Alphaproteobacteria bacterium]